MNAARYARVRELFLAARERPASERESWLQAACAADLDLRAQAERLLAHGDDAHSFLEHPALGERLDESRLELGIGEPAPGERVGAYRIVRKLGEGGFGAVYEAEQLEPVRRHVALKILKAGMDSRAVLARFAGEQQALARMDHPYVARVFDAGLAPSGRPFFALELVEGEPIHEYCARHALSLRERLVLFARVCEALQHAHHKGLIHRDVKPSNVLVSGERSDPRPKVIDFGVAKALGTDGANGSFVTESGLLVGTLAYMSPEQAGPLARDIDTRSDVYSLGALLYELLAGTPPFDPARLRAVGLAEVVRILQEEEPPAPSVRATVRAKELRGDLDWIAMRALEKDRERRYASAHELAADVARHLASEPVLAGPPSAAYRWSRFARRHRAAVAGAAACCFALCAGLATTLWQSRVAIAARDEAQVEAESVLAVLEFVNRTMSSVRPENARGAEPTVREMLERAARQADEAFAGRPPQVEGHVRALIGNAFRSLSRYDEARPQLERSLELFRGARGESEPQTLRALNDLAQLDAEQGRFDDAEQRFRSSLDLCRIELGPTHLRTLTAALNLSGVLRRLGRPDEARELLEDVCRIEPGASEPERRLHLVAAQNLAGLLAQMGDLAAAVERLKGVLDEQHALLGADHPEALDSQANLAAMLAQLQRVDEADTLLVATLAAQRRVLGTDHASTAASATNLAGIRLHQRRTQEAIELYELALATYRARLGDDHADTRTVAQRLELARDTDRRSALADTSR